MPSLLNLTDLDVAIREVVYKFELLDDIYLQSGMEVRISIPDANLNTGAEFETAADAFATALADAMDSRTTGAQSIDVYKSYAKAETEPEQIYGA